jgi:hypothetical protein
LDNTTNLDVARKNAMTNKQAGASWPSLAAFFLLLSGLPIFPARTLAQMAPGPGGESAIYLDSGNPVHSQALVDASVFYGSQGDFCQTINFILTDNTEFQCGSANSPHGVVVDARGIHAPTPSVLQCGNTPFDGTKCGGYLKGDSLAVTILLPAATIHIQKPWILPSNARIVGEGKGLTILQACTTTSGCSANFAGADMVDLGDPNCPHMMNSPPDCQGNGIEHLTIDGNGQNVNGIVNAGSQELSYVNDVSLTNLGGIGLSVTSVANNSGPYSNIYSSGSGTCASINGTVNTRGIHGLSCTTTASSSSAVLLDAQNNSIEDVYIQGYQNGILVGANADSQNNLLFNINGASDVTNVVHICGPFFTSPCPSTAKSVRDLTLSGITSSAHNTIKDDITQTTLTFATDPSVGLYVLGESVTAGTNNTAGYSRFSTSPSLPTWLVASGPPSSPCATGSLYSDTSGPASQTLWTCVNKAWKIVK